MTLKPYTVIGTIDGQTIVQWVTARNVENAIHAAFTTDRDGNPLPENEDDWPGNPPEEILAVFEGHLQDVIGDFHDGMYPLDRNDYLALEGTP